MTEKEIHECFYCGGNCPLDEDNACDGYQGDIENLYVDLDDGLSAVNE